MIVLNNDDGDSLFIDNGVELNFNGSIVGECSPLSSVLRLLCLVCHNSFYTHTHTHTQASLSPL